MCPNQQWSAAEVSVVVDSNAAVNDLADRFWDGVLERDSMWATVLGDERFNDQWPDLGSDGRAAEEAAYRATLAEAKAIPADWLDPEQVITRDLLILVTENQLEALAQKQYQLGLDHMSGPQVWPAEMAQYQPADTAERLDKLITRFSAYPAMIEQYIGTLREGIADGRAAAAVPVRRAIEQSDRLLAMAPADHPAASMAQTSDEDRPRVVAVVEEHVYGGLRQLRDFLADEYEPKARQQPGLSASRTAKRHIGSPFACRRRSTPPRRRFTPSAWPIWSRSRRRRTRSRAVSDTRIGMRCARRSSVTSRITPPIRR